MTTHFPATTLAAFRRRWGFLLLLGGIVAAALSLRVWRIDADLPAGVSRDLSLSVDGSWYTSAALDHERGRAVDIPKSYDRPVYTTYLDMVYGWLGPTLRAGRLASVLPALVAIVLGALLARTLYGPAAGLIAATLLALNHAFLVFNQSPIIYTFLSMLSVAVLFLAVKGSRARSPAFVAAAWLLAAVGILAAKVSLVLLLPALALGWPVFETVRGRSPRTLAALALVGALFGALAIALGAHERIAQKLTDYLFSTGGAGYIHRFFDLEGRSGLFRAAPVMATLAVLGGLGARGREERMVAAFVVVNLLAFALLNYSPLRYFVPVFPAMAVLAAGMLARLLRGGEILEWARAAARPAWFKAPLGLYFLYQASVAVVPGSLVLRLAVLLLAVGAAAALRLRPRTSRAAIAGQGPHALGFLPAAVAVALSATVLLVQGGRVAQANSSPRYTVRHAVEEIEAVLAPGARLSGLFAHLLTTESGHDRKLIEAVRYGRGALEIAYRKERITHLTLEVTPATEEIVRLFAADGAELDLVHTLAVRGVAVSIYRFPWAEELYRLSPYEEGLRELSQMRVAEAMELLRSVSEKHPRAGAPHSALALAHLSREETDEARTELTEALARNPYDLRAWSLRARLLLEEGRTEDARIALEWLHSLDSRNPSLAALLEGLEASSAR